MRFKEELIEENSTDIAEIAARNKLNIDPFELVKDDVQDTNNFTI